MGKHNWILQWCCLPVFLCITRVLGISSVQSAIFLVMALLLILLSEIAYKAANGGGGGGVTGRPHSKIIDMRASLTSLRPFCNLMLFVIGSGQRGQEELVLRIGFAMCPVGTGFG